MSIHSFPNKRNSDSPPVDPPGGGGDNGGMDARVAKLEAIITTLATKEDFLRLELSTKSEVLRLEAKLHQEMNAQTWKFVTWMTGICTALIAATYFIATHVK